ncbi:MAG: carbohydrate-binding protein, partial [Verrucomicrobiota bacterium]
SARPSGGTIQIREGSADGKLLGRCLVPKTGGWDKYQIVSCVLNNQAATENLCLIFQGGAGELMRLDWLAFSAE